MSSGLPDLSEYGKQLSEQFPGLDMKSGFLTSFLQIYQGTTIIARLYHDWSMKDGMSGIRADFFEPDNTTKYEAFAKALEAMSQLEENGRTVVGPVNCVYAVSRQTNNGINLVLKEFPDLLQKYLSCLK